MMPLIVAGGCYIETCEAPAWRATFGSGGRAAIALAGFGPVRLHTYYPIDRISDLSFLERRGVEVVREETPTALVFAYFHPLSDPVIAPYRPDIPHNAPLSVVGDVVLRFGMLEGDAIVAGRRVVYDPQSVGDFAAFGQNGSRADHLALVLNVDELQAASGERNIPAAAQALLRSQEAEVIVVKGGVRGASVHCKDRPPEPVPAYWSDRVFKIGTGDIFSAAFAHYWGRLAMDSGEAARIASRSVAWYSGGGDLPLPSSERLGPTLPVTPAQCGQVTVFGTRRRLADRWLVEETVWRLRGLGIEPILDDGSLQTAPQAGASLVLADQFSPAALEEVLIVAGPNVVIFSENEVVARGRTTPDFATALYWASWLS